MNTMHFEDDGQIPNNPRLPLILYRGVLPGGVDACRELFARHGWGGMWVDGVFPYHHYHSTAHEALGVVGGSAEVQFGGPQGEIVTVQSGDVVIIPAGVGHCRISASGDFSVVGAYPAGQNWDLRTGEPGDRPEVLHNIEAVPLPQQDPVYGDEGGLLEVWL